MLLKQDLLLDLVLCSPARLVSSRAVHLPHPIIWILDCTVMPNFYVGADGVNADTQALSTSTLLSETAPPSTLHLMLATCFFLILKTTAFRARGNTFVSWIRMTNIDKSWLYFYWILLLLNL